MASVKPKCVLCGHPVTYRDTVNLRRGRVVHAGCVYGAAGEPTPRTVDPDEPMVLPEPRPYAMPDMRAVARRAQVTAIRPWD